MNPIIHSDAIAQSLDLTAPPRTFTHLIVLVHPVTDKEASIWVETQSDSFCDVHRELCKQRIEQGLKGYEIFEVMQIGDPF